MTWIVGSIIAVVSLLALWLACWVSVYGLARAASRADDAAATRDELPVRLQRRN